MLLIQPTNTTKTICSYAAVDLYIAMATMHRHVPALVKGQFWAVD